MVQEIFGLLTYTLHLAQRDQNLSLKKKKKILTSSCTIQDLEYFHQVPVILSGIIHFLSTSKAGEWQKGGCGVALSEV